MGWEMPWYTITDDFDADFGVDEWHGTNAFFRDGERIFRTYFIDSRGDEAMGSTWSYLDITALGRQEEWEDSPEGYPQTPPYQWWNYHDDYDEAAHRSSARAGGPHQSTGELPQVLGQLGRLVHVEVDAEDRDSPREPSEIVVTRSELAVCASLGSIVPQYDGTWPANCSAGAWSVTLAS